MKPYGTFGLHRSPECYLDSLNVTAEDVFGGDCGCGGIPPEYETNRSVLSYTANTESDDSCSELEFINSQSLNGVVPFTPRRSSTPKVCTPMQSNDKNVPNWQVGMDSKADSAHGFDLIGRMSVMESSARQMNPRRLPAYQHQFPPIGTFGQHYKGCLAVPDMNATSNSIGYGTESFSMELVSQKQMTLADHCAAGVRDWRVGHNLKDPMALQAQAYRLAASICVPNVVWSGVLPARNCKGSAYSCKVFLGGVPWDITESNLNQAFGKFGSLKVEWPSNHQADRNCRNSKGYLYIVFDEERSVRELLKHCTLDLSNGGRNYYYKVCSNRLRRKDVQVIPWQLADSTYVRSNCMSENGTKTVFVGSLHGMLNAEGLARVMDDLFQNVVAANIDTDKHKYPIGSGRVVFNCTHSYIKAIRAAFVELRTQKFSKKIQIDPFLEDSMCSVCNATIGPFFCRDFDCFKYFCGTCWQWQHSTNETLKAHTPMMRNSRVHDNEF